MRAGAANRIFGAHAAHMRCCGLRSSLTHQRMRALRCSAAPSIWDRLVTKSCGGPPGLIPWRTLNFGVEVTDESRASRERMRVLFVEDDPSVAQMYKLKLELDGYDVEVASDG